MSKTKTEDALRQENEMLRSRLQEHNDRQEFVAAIGEHLVDPSSTFKAHRGQLRPGRIAEDSRKLLEYIRLTEPFWLRDNQSKPTPDGGVTDEVLSTVFGPRSDIKRAQELATKDMGAYMRLRAVAKERGLVR